MKKHLSAFAVTVMLLSSPFIASAQLEKGKFVVGGDISYSKKYFPESQYSNNSGYYSKSSHNYRDLSFDLSIGYMITNRFEVGLNGSFLDNISKSQHETSSHLSINKSANKGYGFGPYIRFYQPVIEKFYLFGNLQGQVQNYLAETKNEYLNKDSAQLDQNINKQDYFVTSTYFNPGFIYMPVKWLSIEMAVGSIGWSQNLSSNELNFDFNLNLKNISLGSRFYF